MTRWGSAGVWLLAAGLAGCPGSIAKAPPEEVLALPSDTLVAGWGNLPLAAPLGNQRWAVVAPDWDAAAIADFGEKTITPLGGPKQTAYLHPFALFVFGDTIYIADWGKRRVTVWTADNRLIDSIPAADPLRGSLARARDAAAQFYFEVPPDPRPDGSGNQDSAVIVRTPRDLSRFDTVARLAPLDLKQMNRERTSRFERRVFSGNDLWSVFPDGTVWVIRLLHNQVTLRDPTGVLSKGPELPDPVYEVTQADRTRYLMSFPSDLRPKETDLPFALIHPPFVAAMVQPGNGIWVEKSKMALDSVRRIQVLDRGGDLRRLLRLSGDARLLGVGEDRILVAEQFEKGIRLMQIRIPAPPTP